MDWSKQFDLIVVGGGPAGLSAAQIAAKQGISVLVLERSLEIGYPVHTSGGSWITELRQLGVPDRFIHPIKTLQFISSNAQVEFDYEVPEVCMIDIRAVYQHLAEQASKAGAVIWTNTTVHQPLLQDGKVIGVKAVRNGYKVDLKAKMVIDASGMGGLLARAVGLANKQESYGRGAEYEIITSTWQQDKTVILLGSQYTPLGYGWVFPYGDCRVRVGIGVIYPKVKAEPLELLEKFLSEDSVVASQLKPYSIIETHLGCVPNSGFIAKSYADNLLVTGDAAGQVLGIAGEGIRLALDIGQMAGETAAQAIIKQDTTSSFLATYEQRWQSKYARSISINKTMNGIISGFDDSQWDKAVRVMAEIDPTIVLELMKGNFNLNLVKLILTKNPGLFAFKTMQLIRKAITG